MLTEAGKYGKLYLAQSEKQSRVSTLTIAQVSDYWSDIVTCRKFPAQIIAAIVDTLQDWSDIVTCRKFPV